eukprot:GILK01000854.1.p1 GENE.GILK01000854.1~~GILK01000854.1.p1  ORF type:complete len:527 (+),score=94.26 GILK01000854.1:149-1582(+)
MEALELAKEKLRSGSITGVTRWSEKAEHFEFKQRLDHFNAAESRTFQQSYWVNRAYWDQATGPVFFYIGGEGPLSGAAIEAPGEIAELAAQYKALLVALEHRYYGQSLPFADFNTENMQYLSSMQALEDIKSFWSFFNEQEKIDAEKQPWISVGGSYPGSLSAWLRLKYPNVVNGALASSAPVHAKADFFEYDQVVRQSLEDFSSQCASSIKSSLQLVDAYLSAEQNLETLYSQFGCGKSIEDPTAFAYVTADAVSFAIQYTQSSTPGKFTYKIRDQLCSNVTATPTIETLAQFVSWLHVAMGTTCREQNMESIVDTRVSLGASRPWFYQSCTEFGYFQTAPKENSLRSSRINLQWHVDLCTKAFKTLSADSITALIAATNSRYGSTHIHGSNIVFSNGSLDPWKSLSITAYSDVMSKTVLPYVIQGTSHCGDLHGSTAADGESLVALRKLTAQHFALWLNKGEHTRELERTGTFLQ